MFIPLVVKVFSNYIIEHYAVTPCNHWGVFREVLLYAQFVSLFYTFRGMYSKCTASDMTNRESQQ